MLVESIRTPYDVILLLHHIALRTMHDLSVGGGLVVVMLDSLGLCHFHISVNFSKKQKKKKKIILLPSFQVSCCVECSHSL